MIKSLERSMENLSSFGAEVSRRFALCFEPCESWRAPYIELADKPLLV